MTVEDDVAWSKLQPGDPKFELIDGVPVRVIAPSTISHGCTKGRVWGTLSRAIGRAGRLSEAYLDSAGARIEEVNARIPGVSVQCSPLEGNAIWLDSPLILVEIVLPGSGTRDRRDKLIDYFRVLSVVYYLVAYSEERVVVHHRRPVGETDIATRILSDGHIELSPPGFTVSIGDFFEPEVPVPNPM